MVTINQPFTPSGYVPTGTKKTTCSKCGRAMLVHKKDPYEFWCQYCNIYYDLSPIGVEG